jgi:predicted DCC family thiol-disulfide oxidoreductase YuxK
MSLTVVFDQDCGVCTASVDWLRRLDRAGVLRFTGNQGELPAGVPREETGETIFVVDELRGRVFTRAHAVSRALLALSGWRTLGLQLLGLLMLLPGLSWLADRGYRAFARRRHRVSAALGLQSCRIPDRR